MKNENAKKIACNKIYKHIAQTDAKIIICYGGRDSGKSYFVGGQWIPGLMTQPDYFRGVCVRRFYSEHKGSCFDEVVDGIGVMGRDNDFNVTKSPYQIEHKNGNRLMFRGFDTPKKLKSIKGVSFIWAEEAEDMNETQFFDLLMLLRGGNTQKLVLTYNPVDEDHFTNAMFVESIADEVIETDADGDKKVWVKYLKVDVESKEEKIKCLVVRSTYEDNAFITPERKAAIELLKTTDPYLYEVYRKGKYGTRGGRILYNVEVRDFDAEGWQFVNYDKKGYVQDFGFNHANAILSVAESDNCLYVFDELYGREKTTNEWIAVANKLGLERQLLMICDSEDPGQIKTWSNAGYMAYGVKKYQGSVRDQIDKLKAFNKIYINAKCTNTYKESKNWKWRQDKNGKFLDEPMTQDDDAMAALRYSCDLFGRTGKRVY